MYVLFAMQDLKMQNSSVHHPAKTPLSISLTENVPRYQGNLTTIQDDAGAVDEKSRQEDTSPSLHAQV
jgi:hypothetical protein